MTLGAPLTSGQETELLRTTVEQWVATMQKIQEEQARWTREKQVLLANREGLEQEIVDLKEAIESTGVRLADVDKSEEDKLEKKRQFDRAREALARRLVEVEADALKVVPLLPAFYLKENTKLAAAIDALAKTAAAGEKEKGGLGARLSTAVLILSEAEKFQMQSWVRDEEREVDGTSMLVTTIYFGLSTAFAADELQTVGLRGRPGPSGWAFDPLPEKDAPKQIRDLINVATLEGEIKFVEIPLELR